MSSVNSQALSFLEVDTDLLANTQASSQFEYPDFTISSQSQTQTQLTQNDSVKDRSLRGIRSKKKNDNKPSGTVVILSYELDCN